MIALLDIGNTRLKWQVLTLDYVVCERGVVDGKKEFAQLLQVFNKFALKYLYIAYAAPADQRSALRQMFEHALSIPVCMIQVVKFTNGLEIAYSQPETYGVDRFLALYALRNAMLGRNRVLISLGTAVTIDVLTSGNVHDGGLIFPGAQLMKQALLNQTEGIVDVAGNDAVGLAKNTPDSVSSGSYFAQKFAVLGVVTELQRIYDSLVVFVSGGGVTEELILQLGAIHCEDVVFDGMRALIKDKQCVCS